MDFFKENFRKNFNAYQDAFLSTLSDFIESMSIENEFNFTYLNLYLLISRYEESFFLNLKKTSQDYWFYDNFKIKIPKGFLGDLGLNNNRGNDLSADNSKIFKNMQEIWLGEIHEHYKIFIQLNDFTLMVEDYDINKIKGKNREIASAYNAIFNIDGWMNFLSKLFNEKLSDFTIV